MKPHASVSGTSNLFFEQGPIIKSRAEIISLNAFNLSSVNNRLFLPEFAQLTGKLITGVRMSNGYMAAGAVPFIYLGNTITFIEAQEARGFGLCMVNMQGIITHKDIPVNSIATSEYELSLGIPLQSDDKNVWTPIFGRFNFDKSYLIKYVVGAFKDNSMVLEFRYQD